ncbi:hypothetical protein E4K73_49525 [Streptomyces sp. IB201691-2A2]|nr:hypothetical protein E4K73_49525 [Streptomyces sp. IB201691-2A2]
MSAKAAGRPTQMLTRPHLIKKKPSAVVQGARTSKSSSKETPMPPKGKKQSQATKDKIREALSGRTLSGETKARMSAVQSARSQATKDKMSRALSGRTLPEETKARMSAAAFEREKEKRGVWGAAAAPLPAASSSTAQVPASVAAPAAAAALPVPGGTSTTLPPIREVLADQYFSGRPSTQPYHPTFPGPLTTTQPPSQKSGPRR